MPSAKAPHCQGLPLWIPALDLDSAYLGRFDVEELLEGTVALLSEKGRPDKRSWTFPEKSHLWNFNLHYLEFLIPLTAAYRRTGDARFYKRFRGYCRSWIEANRDGTGDGWHPYTISLRLTNLWICLDGFREKAEEDQAFLKELKDSMYAQYLHLQRRLERHLLGNHYLENLKAILLGSLYFGEPKTYKEYKRLLREELKEQILPDGVHYERSLMYHKIVLEDLMRLAKAVGTGDPPFFQELLDTVQRMADAMYSLEKGMGRTPLFNDAGDNVARPMESLLWALQEEFSIAPGRRDVFPEAGYYCIEKYGLKILLDAGELGPCYMPGHSHCDGLSFELALDGRALFVNSGTGLYQGRLRPYFRSTAAHNTVVVDGEEQSECWGAHRAARRISRISGKCGGDTVSGRLTTCTGKRQERTLKVRKDGTVVLEILDRIPDGARAQAYFHLAPDYEYIPQAAEGVLVQDGRGRKLCTICLFEGDRFRIHKDGEICSYAPEFGKLERVQVLEIRWTGGRDAHRLLVEFCRGAGLQL